jgi:hypothetical protein
MQEQDYNNGAGCFYEVRVEMIQERDKVRHSSFEFSTGISEERA